LERLLGTLWRGEVQVISSAHDIDVVGHRVVHGGPHFEEPILITHEVQSVIASMSAFAPLHIQAEVEGIETIRKLLSSAPQEFDTEFHRQMPLSAAVYPGPYEWFEGGIHRYGFHGINH
jgi:acetate kinase